MKFLDFDEASKQGQIRNIFFTLKILALFFSSIPLFQYFSVTYQLDFFNYKKTLYSISFSLLIICVVTFCWLLIFNRKKNNAIFKTIEATIFFAVFLIAIFVSGANTSNYKFLFLFIIISYTIEFGMKHGIILASASSLAVVLIDFIFGSNNGINQNFQNDLALLAMFFLVAWTLGYYVKLEQSHIERLTEYANIDGLTGIYNHRYFHDRFSELCDLSKKQGCDLSLLIIDLDYFKKYNDVHGHKQGDLLLKEVTAVIQGVLDPSHILCRYGGDEFCIILPDTNKEKAEKIANTVKDAVCSGYYVGQEYLPNSNLTISIGVSSLSNNAETYDNLIENADLALYKAKFLRRNKVEVYSSVFDQFAGFDNISFDEVIKPLKALISVINSRDTYTFKHTERVVSYCNLMADHLGMSLKDKRMLMYAAYLHDLGKINIPKEILVADNKLTPSQWEELKRHPEDSAEIIRELDGFEDVIPIVLQHHEKYDGTGYPKGLAGENITYLARVLTIIDSFDAMTNQRTYQKIRTFEEAFAEIERCKGTHFDPAIADEFIKMIQQL